MPYQCLTCQSLLQTSCRLQQLPAAFGCHFWPECVYLIGLGTLPLLCVCFGSALACACALPWCARFFLRAISPCNLWGVPKVLGFGFGQFSTTLAQREPYVVRSPVWGVGGQVFWQRAAVCCKTICFASCNIQVQLCAMVSCAFQLYHVTNSFGHYQFYIICAMDACWRLPDMRPTPVTSFLLTTLFGIATTCC